MKHTWRMWWCAWLIAGGAVLTLSAADPGITLIGMGLVPGTDLDRSGLDGLDICRREDPADCIDQATMGGFGSALAYTGHDSVFLAFPDRGPFDGRTDVPYLDRFHFLHFSVDVGAPFPNIETVLLDTQFLRNKKKPFVGDAYAFSTTDPLATRRFDPEGAALGRHNTVFVSDEYGPYINEFDRHGQLVRRIPVPSRFLLKDPPFGNQSGDVDAGGTSVELYPTHNIFGRQANRGMEGLAITPDGQWLVGIMQNALIQDSGLNTSTPPGRRGFNNRVVTINLKTGETHEYVYAVDAINQGRGVNDILAINDHEFLVLERDNRSFVPTPPNGPQAPNLKRIYKIDLNQPNLTDVSDVENLPETAAQLATFAPVPVVPFTKTKFIDLLDPAYIVDATTTPPKTIKDVVAEKVEGMAWGPDLPDGRHVLFVATDNDLFPGRPTQIYAFAVDGSATGANIKYQPQKVGGPMFPPGELKKALKK